MYIIMSLGLASWRGYKYIDRPQISFLIFATLFAERTLYSSRRIIAESSATERREVTA